MLEKFCNKIKVNGSINNKISQHKMMKIKAIKFSYSTWTMNNEGSCKAELVCYNSSKLFMLQFTKIKANSNKRFKESVEIFMKI